MPKNKGFTMLELMVTIGIIAIIAAIGIPAYSNWIPKYKLSRDVTNLKSDLEMAKLTAKRENACIGVRFANTAAGGEYTIFRDNGANSCNFVKDGDETIIKYQELSPGDIFESLGVVVEFRGNGEVRGPGGSPFNIGLKGYGGANDSEMPRKRIEISFLGRIAIK